MIVRTLNDQRSTDKNVTGPGWASCRMLTRADGMGFSVNDTTVLAGAELKLEYKNHLEACFCIEGEGEIEDHATGNVHRIQPGTIYALNKHDKHTLRVTTAGDMRLVSVFNPALEGSEVHGPDGSYSQ